MQSLNSASSVMLPLCGKVHGVSIFFGVEDSEVDDFLVDADLGSPLFSPGHPTYSGKAGCIGADSADIFAIDLRCCVPEIFDSIVVAYPVFMVDNPIGPLPIMKKPSNAMGEVPATIDVKVQIPFRRVLTSSDIANFDGPGKANSPRNHSSIGVVAEKFACAQGGNSGFHAAYSSTEAARGDEIRSGLEACYSYADALRKPK